MSKNINNKKALAEQLKSKLNSPDYVAMSDLITYDDRLGDMLTWLWGSKKDGNIHKKDNWISGTNINLGKGNKHESERIVSYDELEKDDWEEIVNLIEKRNKEKEQIYDQKRENIKQKLNNTPNLYYRFSTNKRISASYFTYPDKHGEYFNILGLENGKEYFLNINISHPVLNNFPWKKNGYYLIETDKKIERNDKFGRPWSDGGETNPSNFHKWVEVGDQITITPYEITGEEIAKPENRKSIENDSNKVINQGNANNENKSLINKEINSDFANFLLQYFQSNGIREIELVDGELVIEYNKKNNSSTEKSNSQELQLVKNIIRENGQQKLTREELSKLVNANSNSLATENPKNNNALLISCGIGGTLIIGIVIGLWLRKKDKKS